MIHVVGDKAKGRISKRVFQENNARQIFRKTNISYPLISTLQKCSFFGKFGVLYFLEPPVLRFALFALLPTISSVLLLSPFQHSILRSKSPITNNDVEIIISLFKVNNKDNRASFTIVLKLVN